MKPKKIKDLMSQGNLDDKIITIIDRLMSFRHQPYSEILKMPIPLIDKIMKRIDKQIERENKSFKK